MRVSIITPTFNRSKLLNETITSVLSQKFDNASVEYLVVDNNSTDDTKLIIEKKIKTSTLIKLKYLYEKKQGINSARNLGVQKSNGEYIIFFDDDVFLAEGCLQEYINAFHNNENASVFGGSVELKPPEFDLPSWFAVSGKFVRSMIVISLYCGQKNYLKSLSKDLIPLGANMAFNRNVFTQNGLFSTDLGLKGEKLMPGSEYEFCQRISTNGIDDWLYLGKAKVYHPIKKEQVRKNYFRKRLFGVGRVTYKLHPFKSKKTVLGLPLYMLEFILSNILKSIKYKIQSKEIESFYYQTEALIYCGCVYEHFNKFFKEKRGAFERKL